MMYYKFRPVPMLPLITLCILLLATRTTMSYLVTPPVHSAIATTTRHSYIQPLCYANRGDDGQASSSSSSFDSHVLQRRLLQVRAQVLEEEYRQPPNPKLSAKEFVGQILHALWDSSMPDAGFRVLLRSATPAWRYSLYQSVGAPLCANEEIVASALGESIARPNNQFAILVEDEQQDDHVQTPYSIEFPSDEVDYGDGTCWVECRLRAKKDRTLYVVMGWQLHERPTDGAWLVHRVDWQDFRDDYRPGIGREEWMRICK